MRRTWLAIVVAACGGGASPKPVENATPAANGDPHRSREAMVKEIIALASAGSADELVALASFGEDVVCDGEGAARARKEMTDEALDARIRLRRFAGRAHGAAIEVVSLGEPRPYDMGADLVERKCSPKTRVVRDKLEVKLRIKGAEAAAEVKVLDVGGTFYAYSVEVDESVLPAQPLVDRYRTLVQRACACKDAACAEVVAAEHMGEAMDYGAAESNGMDMTALKQLRDQLVACGAKLGL